MDENAIEKLLISDWASGLRITTVPQAMDRLGMADDLATRWEMADRMDALWHSTLGTPEKVQAVNSAIGSVTDGCYACVRGGGPSRLKAPPPCIADAEQSPAERRLSASRELPPASC